MNCMQNRRGIPWTLLFILLSIFLNHSCKTTPQVIPLKTKIGDCTACHGKKQILPDGHTDTRILDWKGCQSCHSVEAAALSGKIWGSHLHQLAGLDCNVCHGETGELKAVGMEVCVICHGDIEALEVKTENLEQMNPHISMHFGPTDDCNLCHHQHEKSENMCLTCHPTLEFIVP